MKRNILLLFLVVAISISSFAQMTYDPDSAFTQLIAETEVDCRIKLTNNWSHDVQLSWRMIGSSIKDYGYPGGSWLVQYCDCNNCASNEFGLLNQGDTCANMLPSKASIDWYMKVDAGTIAIANAEWIVEVYNHTDGVYDTISYFLLGEPNAIKETTFNADVKSYPNPANNEMVIDYELKNLTEPIFTVYNLIGSKVASYPLNKVNGRLNLNTSNFENGMYFYTIEENGQRVFIQKFNVVH